MSQELPFNTADYARYSSLTEMLANANDGGVLLSGAVPFSRAGEAYAEALAHVNFRYIAGAVHGHDMPRGFYPTQLDIFNDRAKLAPLHNGSEGFGAGFGIDLSEKDCSAYRQAQIASTLDGCLPQGTGRNDFIASLCLAADAFSEVRKARGGARIFGLGFTCDTSVEQHDWHRDRANLMNICGATTCWRPNEAPEGEPQRMKPRHINMWNELLHARPTHQMNGTRSRVWAIFS